MKQCQLSRHLLGSHVVVGLDGAIDVFLVDADRHAHDHLLRPLHHLPKDTHFSDQELSTT
jgi:hypothetical protein